MCDKDQNHANIDELLHLIGLVCRRVHRLGQVDTEQSLLPLVQRFKLVYTNPRKQDVLDAEEAHQESIESAFANSVYLSLLLLCLLLQGSSLLRRMVILLSINIHFHFALFDVLHADLLEQIDEVFARFGSRAWIAARESSHAVINPSQRVCVLDGQLGEKMVYFAFMWENCFRTIIEHDCLGVRFFDLILRLLTGTRRLLFLCGLLSS